MKFIHTSDWHIGRQFHNVSLLPDQSAILDQILAYVEQEGVDALVVAGDIYDRAIPPVQAVSELNRVLDTLCEKLHVPVILIPGNHDNAERLGFAAKQMRHSGLKILSRLEESDKPVEITCQDGSIARFYGLPYHTPEQVKSCFNVETASFQQAHEFLVQRITNALDPQYHNILLSHCFIQNSKESESERPLSVGGADQVDPQHLNSFDYVALGHLHNPQRCGAEHIRYSGSILKYSFSESQQSKSVELVELKKSRDRFKCSRLALQAKRDVRELEGSLEHILKQAQADSRRDDFLRIRLTDTHAILDILGKLRAWYPNVLQIERIGLKPKENKKLAVKGKIQKQYSDMFADFYQQVCGEDLTQKQIKAIKAVILGLQTDQRLTANSGASSEVIDETVASVQQALENSFSQMHEEIEASETSTVETSDELIDSGKEELEQLDVEEQIPSAEAKTDGITTKTITTKTPPTKASKEESLDQKSKKPTPNVKAKAKTKSNPKQADNEFYTADLFDTEQEL